MEIRSYSEFTSGIREQVFEAEHVYRNKQRGMVKTNKSDEDEEEEHRLRQEIIRLNSLIQKNQGMLKTKKEQLTAYKEELEKLNVEVEKLESDVATLEKELEKAKWRLQEEQNLDEVEKLEKELQMLQGKERELMMDTFQKVLEGNAAEETEKKEQEIAQCSYDYMKKVKEFEDYLRELENSKVKPRRQRLRNMNECLALLRAEYEELQKTNEKLEEEIKTMESGKSICLM